MECDIRRHSGAVGKLGLCACHRGGPRCRSGAWRKALTSASADERGQSTVEYAVIAAAFIAIVVALGALSNALDEGMFVRHAIAAASHNVESGIGGVVDAFCF